MTLAGKYIFFSKDFRSPYALMALFFLLSGAALSETLYRAEYQYNIRGFVTNLVEEYGGGIMTRELEYDRRGQLVSEQIGAYQAQYEYDHLGNRVRQTRMDQERTYNYNTRNELIQLQIAGVTRSLYYDLNGSLTQKVEGTRSTEYEWDSRGRLTQVQTNGIEVFRADYAGGLNRLRKAEGNHSKVYRHDGATAIQEIDESGGVKELVRADRGASTVGGILYSADDEGTNTYTYNGVGSTVVLSADDATARIAKYDAFGNILEADTGVDSERLANTKELDPSTGLYFHGARYFDSEIGRYISLDSARDGINYYVYAKNAPQSFVDPTGLSGEAVWDTYFAPTFNTIGWAARKTIVEPLGYLGEKYGELDYYLQTEWKIPVYIGGPIAALDGFFTTFQLYNRAKKGFSGGRSTRVGSQSGAWYLDEFNRNANDLPPGAKEAVPRASASPRFPAGDFQDNVRMINYDEDGWKVASFVEEARMKAARTGDKNFREISDHFSAWFAGQTVQKERFWVSEGGDGRINAMALIDTDSFKAIQGERVISLDTKLTDKRTTNISWLVGLGGGKNLMSGLARRTVDNLMLEPSPTKATLDFYWRLKPSAYTIIEGPEIGEFEWAGRALEKLANQVKKPLK